MLTSVTTIERFILDQETRYPEATGELSNLLYDIALAAKIIAAAIRRAGLVNILGAQGEKMRTAARARSSTAGRATRKSSIRCATSSATPSSATRSRITMPGEVTRWKNRPPRMRSP